MASQENQVFHIIDLTYKKWYMVFCGKRQVVDDEDEKDMTNDIEDITLFSLRLLLVNDEANLEESYMKDGNGKGIWVKDSLKEKY